MLDETRRQQLDRIVQDMIRNKESDDNIRFVVDDFKKKYGRADTATPTSQGETGLAGLATGVGKSGARLIKGIGTLGEKVLSPVAGALGVEKPTAYQDLEVAPAQGMAEKVGSFAGDVAQFAIPGGAATKATKGAGLLTKAVAQGAVAGGVQAAQEGEIDEGTAITAIFGGIVPPAEKVFSVAAKNLTRKLPEWLVTPLLKQAKDAKIKGKDIAPYLVKTRRIGTVDSLITRSESEVANLSRQVAANLEKAGVAGQTIKREDVLSQVVNKLNEGGDATDLIEVQSVIEKLAPQARGLLKKEVYTPAEANKLRQALDRTLGDRGFLRDQLPYNKEVLRGFANTLRESVKEKAPQGTRELFEKLSKEITLRDALLERASSGGGQNRIGLYDILFSLGGFSQGDTTEERVRNAAIGFGGRRAFESAFIKTGLARLFRSPEVVLPKLEKLSPAIRGAFLEAVSELSSDDDLGSNR